MTRSFYVYLRSKQSSWDYEIDYNV